MPLIAKAQQWQWGKRGQNQTREIAVDRNGNTYLLWAIGSQANVDGHAIPGFGNTDIAITSFRCNGAYRWTKVIGTASPDSGFGLGTDSLDGVYILGHTSSGNASNLYIDDDLTISPTFKKIILVKYDTAGNFIWQRMPEPAGISGVTVSSGFNLSVEPNGNTHIMAVLSPAAYAGGAFTATYPDDKNMYALKYTKDGTFLGGLHFDITRSAAAGISSYGFNMMYDAVTTYYYWAGGRYDPYLLSFGTTAITGSNFLACFDSTGSVLWVQKSNNNAISTGLVGRPATDNLGNVYVTGYSYNDFNGGSGDGFGSYNFNNTYGIWGFPILVKVSPSGTILFATNASGNTDNSGKALAYTNGIIGLAAEYAGGNFEWDGHSLGTNNQYYNDFLARFDANTGNLIAIDTLYSGPGVDEYATVLSADRSGNFYMGGEFNGNITIAGITHNKQDGFTDGYIAKFGSSGCNCIVPAVTFGRTGTGLTYSFSYTGSTPVDSVVWSFGDSHTATGLTATHTYTVSDTFLVCATAYNNCSSQQSCASLVSSGSSNVNVGNFKAFPDLHIYPNPARNILYVTGLSGVTQYRLYNSVGAQLKDGTLYTQQDEINTALLPAGWYTLHLQNKEGNTAQLKVILQ